MERKKMKGYGVLESDYYKNDIIQEDSKYGRKRDDDVQESRFRDDRFNIILLIFLYILQGIPMGFAASVPLILQNRKVSYKQQALFSFVTWPFSMKLLWAPIVDSLYWSRVGRRKSWLVPIQYLIGLFMIILSRHMTTLLGENGGEPNVFLLTVVFFFMNFLCATQDIAVDGWALTMLCRHNVGYASTCNSVGQTAGFFLGNVVFLALESADFCNSYLRTIPQPDGFVTVSSFLMFWGFVYFICTTVVALIKRENGRYDEGSFGIRGTYKMLYRILCLPNVLALVAMLMTCKIGFAATDAATGLKLIEAGVPKERLALLAVPMVPLQILLPVLISRYTAGPRPLNVFLKAYPYRLFCGLLLALLLWWTHYVKLQSGGFPAYYYCVIIVGYALHQVTLYSIFVALMAFFAKVSDPSIGGTYMTLMNTICNLGGNWPATLALWFLDPLTYKTCENSLNLSCDSKELEMECEKYGGHCEVKIDGYYIETFFCIAFGFIWMRWGKPTVLRLQQLPSTAWTCS